MSVIPLKPPEKEQMFVGEAFCNHCRHEWTARAPEGTTQLECPECHTLKGMFRGEHSPSDGEERRECACGGQLFFIMPEGHMCANCGKYQEYE